MVQKYEIIKTEDLPFLENSKFSPNVIRNVAQNILSFLKQNATKSGHTYWLFKGRKDDVVKLYDLTSLGTAGEFGTPKTQSPNGENQNRMNENDEKNPFTVPVAMLLYKVARNMKNSSEKIQPKQAGSMKALLENCIKLLPKEQYPQIVTSSFYLLCDIHLPTGIDPMSPKFENGTAESESVYDDENSSDDSDEQCDKMKKLTKEDKNSSNPPPLVANIEERCQSALQYIVNGLSCLQYISNNEARLNKTEEETNEQIQKTHVPRNEQCSKVNSVQDIPVTCKKNRSKKNKSKKNKQPINVQTNINMKSEKILKPSQGAEWNIHLKMLLLEKSCLIYAILTEQAYQREEYGRSLKFILFATKCYHIVTKLESSLMIGMNYYTNVLARAGDCFFKCAQNINSINLFLDQYHAERDIDLLFEKELHEEFAQINESMELRHPTKNVEQLILHSISSYEMALKFADESSSHIDILGRIGSVLNELGIRYMNWALDVSMYSIATQSDIEKCPDSGDEHLKLTLAEKSYDCLIRGIDTFEKIKDNANLAILLCNMGRFMRFRAHLEERSFSFKKICYESAFTSYQRALTILESKKQNSQLWDVVNWELSSGKFTLAKHMFEHFQKKDMVRYFCNT